MELKEEIPTFEEFRDAVIKDYLDNAKGTPNYELSKKYIKSEEAQKHIEQEYWSNVQDMKDGKINRTVFMHGGVYAVSNCLDLMTRPV